MKHLSNGIYLASDPALTPRDMHEFYSVDESEVPENMPYTWYMAVQSKDGIIALKEPGLTPGDVALKDRNVWSFSDYRALNFLWTMADAIFAGSGILRSESDVVWQAADHMPEIRDYRVNLDKATEYPIKVLLTTQAKDFDLTHPAFNAGSDVIVFTSKIGEEAIYKQLDTLDIEGKAPLHIPTVYAMGEKEVENYGKMMEILRQNHDIKYMDLQGGGIVAGQLLNAKLIQELRLTTSPTTFGPFSSAGERRTKLFEGVSYGRNSPEYERIKVLHAGNHIIERSRIIYHH